MQTVDEVEKHVPVREGDYGERVDTVEPGGVESIALHERHGKPIQLSFTWLSPNLEFATVFIGVIAVAFEGLNLWQAATAIIIGTALGSISHAVLSSWGPKFGVPMMIVSRGPFGFLGNILPAALNGLTASFGWFIVNSVSGAFALQSLFPSFSLPFWLAFLVIVVAQVAIATLGYNLIHLFERVALPLLGIVFIVACFFIFRHGNYGFSPKPIPGGWLLAFTAAFGYAVGWNPFAADYTRYMAPGSNRRMVGFWAGFGVFLSCVVLELAGAVLVTVPGTDWSGIPTAQLQRAMPDVVYYPTLLCIAIGAVAANAINIYSGTMSLVSLGIKEMGMNLRQRRAALSQVHAHLLDAKGDERHGAAVDVDRVRGHRPDRDAQQGRVVDDVGHRALQLSGRDATPIGTGDSHQHRASKLEDDARKEDAEARPEPHHPPVRPGRHIARVVSRERVPADRVAEGGGEGEQPAAGYRRRAEAVVAVVEDEEASDDEHNAQQGQGDALEQMDQVVAQRRDRNLRHDDHQEGQPERQAQRREQRLHRESAADAIDDEPTE